MKIYPGFSVYMVRYSGVLTIQDVRAAQAEIYGAIRNAPVIFGIVLLSDTKDIRLRFIEMIETSNRVSATLNQQKSTLRLALHAPDDDTFAVARMYEQALTSVSETAALVHEDIDVLIDWLGAPALPADLLEELHR